MLVRDFSCRQVVTDCTGDDEVAVRKPLHQCTGPQSINAVIRDVGFSQNKQSGYVAHEIVVDPQTPVV